MDGISDSALVSALRRQMTMASARQIATTGNLANFDTPGYKAKEVTFDQALGQKMLPLNATYKTHIGAQHDVFYGSQGRVALGLPAGGM